MEMDAQLMLLCRADMQQVLAPVTQEGMLFPIHPKSLPEQHFSML